jgi:hypothetical protein
MTAAGKRVATAAAVLAATLLTPSAAQAIEAHYLADISGSESFSGFERYDRPQGSTCTITDTKRVTFNASFETPTPVHLTVSSKQGGTFSDHRVSVKQRGFTQTEYDHEGDASCGDDATSDPLRCKKSSRNKLRFREDTAVRSRSNQSDVFRNAPDKLTLSMLPNDTCLFGLAFADQYVSRFFYPATTGNQKLAKLLSPNTKRITLKGKRGLLEAGPTKVNVGEWQTGWSSKWTMKLERIEP